MKKIISFILVAVFAVSVLSGCGHISTGSKDDSNIDSQTKETSMLEIEDVFANNSQKGIENSEEIVENSKTEASEISQDSKSESEAANGSSPAEISAENSTDGSLQISVKSKPTNAEALAKAKELKDECEKKIREKCITSEKYYEYIVDDLKNLILAEYNLSDEEIIERTVKNTYTNYRVDNIVDKYKAKHREVPEKDLSDPSMVYTNFRTKAARLLLFYYDLELSDEKILEMIEMPIEKYPDYAYQFNYMFPKQESEIAGIGTLNKITNTDLKALVMDVLNQNIQTPQERMNYFREKFLDMKADADLIVFGGSSGDTAYFFTSSDDINDKYNSRFIFGGVMESPYDYYNYSRMSVYLFDRDEKGDIIEIIYDFYHPILITNQTTEEELDISYLDS